MAEQEVKKSLFTSIAMGVIICLLIMLNIMYFNIVSTQEVLNLRIETMSTKPQRDVETLEHKYFLLLKKSYDDCDMGDTEFEYYHHLKKFYLENAPIWNDEHTTPADIITDMRLPLDPAKRSNDILRELINSANIQSSGNIPQL